MHRNLWLATAAMAVAGAMGGVAPPAQAQTVDDDGYELQAVLDVRHDSNVANASAARAELRGIEQEDQVISPAIRASIRKAIGRHSVQANAYAGYDFYMRNTRLNRERISLNAGALVNASICELSPQLSYSRRQSELGDALFFADPSVAVENTQSEQSYGLNASCGAPVGLRAEGGATYSKGYNSNALRETSDFESTLYRAGLGYRQPSIGTLSLYASQQQTEFPNRVIGGVRDEFEVTRIGGSFERNIGARLSGKVEVYNVNVDAASGIGNDFEGLGYRADLTLRASDRTRAKLSIAKDVQTALNNDALYTTDGSYGFSVSQALGSRLVLDAGYVLRDRQYVYSTFVPPIGDETLLDDKLHTVTATLGYDTQRPLRFSLYGGYESRQANGEFFDYDGYFVGLNIAYTLGR